MVHEIIKFHNMNQVNCSALCTWRERITFKIISFSTKLQEMMNKALRGIIIDGMIDVIIWTHHMPKDLYNPEEHQSMISSSFKRSHLQP